MMEGLLGVVGTLAAFVFVLSMVIFFHELGHWGVARLCKVPMESFSIGFGRALWKRKDSQGMEWKIGWLPLGGYVKFIGDRDIASNPDPKEIAAVSEDQRRFLFAKRPLWQRTSIVAAGPVANFILAVVLLSGLFMVSGRDIYEPVIGAVSEGSAAQAAGFVAGDTIIAIDDEPVNDFVVLGRIVRARPGEEMQITIERGAQTMLLQARPKLVEETDRFGNVYRIGRLGVAHARSPEHVRHVRFSPFAAIGAGVAETSFIIKETMRSLWNIIIGRQSASGLGGPIFIAQLSGETATLGFAALLNFIALISISIGLINLFPIPILDGGQLLFYAYEGVVGRPLSERLQSAGMLIGLVMLALLFAFVTWNDIQRLLG